MTVSVPQIAPDPRQVVRGLDANSNLIFSQVGVEEISYRGRYGAVTTSTTVNTIGLGDQWFDLDTADEKFRIGDDVLISSPDPDAFEWGEITGKDYTSTPARIRVYIDDISDGIGTYGGSFGGAWEIQVVARPKPGIERDVSFSSNDPTAAGPFTFVITAGKFFPVGGTLLIKPNADRSIALLAAVDAYSGTNLIVNKTTTNAVISASYDSWSVALLDAPPSFDAPVVPYRSIVGLRVTRDSSDPLHDIRIEPGATPDSTGERLLELTSALVKKLDAVFAEGTNQGAAVLTAAFAGTGTSAATAPPLYTITGTGTAYTTNFADVCGLNDWDARADDPSYLLFSNSTRLGIFSHSDDSYATARLADPDTATSLLTVTTVNPSMTSAQIKRGGVIGTSLELATLGIVLAENDTTGVCDVCSCSLTPSGEPDLPANYTHYAVLALVAIPSGATGNIARIRNSRGEAHKLIESGSLNSGTTKVIAVPSGFSMVKLTFDDVSFVSATRRLLVRASTDGGATFDSTVANYVASLSVGDLAIASFLSNGDQAAAAVCDGSLLIEGYDTEGWKPFRSRTISGALKESVDGYYGVDDPITHLQILSNGAGNFDGGGSYKFVGIR